MTTTFEYTADDIIQALQQMQDERQRDALMRFFKTGAGDYGEGDRFLGLRCPQTRMVVREVRGRVALSEVERLIASPWHEVRLCGFLLIVEEMRRVLPTARRHTEAMAARRNELAQFYLRHARQANNWDLVDMTCPKILGYWLLYPQADGTMPDRGVLDHLAESDNLWEQRIAMVTNWMLIRHGQFEDALRIADRLLAHPHDLIHKAVGWMLREVGKENMAVLEDYLERRYSQMSRTTLRYAIEKMGEPQRQAWLRRQP